MSGLDGAVLGGVLSIPIHLNGALLDGTVIASSDPATGATAFMIGTRRHTVRELAALEGKAIVQRGLADWLAYIGEKPVPWPPIRGRDLYETMRRNSAEFAGRQP